MTATHEELLALQKSAGIPNLPTQLTYNCRMAVAGDGQSAARWKEAPHSLVLDLYDEIWRTNNIPSDAARACHQATAGFGPRAGDWTDKPHRIVYDLCSEIERLAAAGEIPSGYSEYTPITVRSSTTLHQELVDDPNSASGKRLEYVDVADPGAAQKKALRDRVSRIIDPKTNEEFDAAYKSGDRFLQIQLINRLQASRDKADKAIAAVQADAPSANFPATISDDDIECAAIAWMWSYSNAIHDGTRIRKAINGEKIPSSPEALWDAVPTEHKASIREDVRAALQVVIDRTRASIAVVANASENDKVDHLMSRIGDVLFCCEGITNGALKDIELIVRDSIRRNPKITTADDSEAEWTMPTELKDDEVALLTNFGNAFKSGAQGASMDADTAQALAKAVLALTKLVNKPGP